MMTLSDRRSVVARFLLLLALKVVVATANESPSTLDSCRAAGFDPYQLACSTCDLLPEVFLEKCKSCCLSYKTLEKRTRRYQSAVVTHAAGMSAYFPAMRDMIDQDWSGLMELKGEKRLMLKDNSDSPQSPKILWFHQLPPRAESMSADELEKLAPETVVLTGWKRDDIREMIKAIIPDQ